MTEEYLSAFTDDLGLRLCSWIACILLPHKNNLQFDFHRGQAILFTLESEFSVTSQACKLIQKDYVQSKSDELVMKM